jgi:hypothetical protein
VLGTEEGGVVRRIVGVHGVGNYRQGEEVEDARQRLAAVWLKHLRRGMPDGQADSLDVSVAYYADHLARRDGQGAVDESLDHLSSDVEELVRSWLGEFDWPEQKAQGVGTWPLRQVVGWLAERRGLGPRLTEEFVSRFFREVAAYLPRAESGFGPRDSARDAVAKEIRARQPQVVLAHSLGSVVAYEALWAEPDIEVDLLVTLGSPLALPHVVFPRLLPAAGEGLGRRPPGVRRWANFADPGDLVAIPNGGISRRFSSVDLDVHDVIDAFDFHRAANYLACGKLAEVLGAGE